MTLARQMAERIVAMHADNLPQAALDWSKVGVMDTLGCALAGVAEDAPMILADVMGMQTTGGEALVLGGASRASALDAALLNGVAAHVLDYDNTAANMGGHVSAVMVPALLAAAEAFNCSGEAVLVAHTDRAQPRTGLEAKFSVQYCVASALLDGCVLLRDFDEAVLREPAVQSVLARVHAAAHVPGQFEAGQGFAAEVKITLNDDRSFASRVMRPLGRTSANPSPPQQLVAKFEDCAASVLPATQVAALSKALDQFVRVTSVRDFMRLLEVPATAQRKIA